MSTRMPTAADIEKAEEAAVRLDIALTDAYFYLDRRTAMRRRLQDLTHNARDIRNALDEIKQEMARDG